jgi:hypothetical protein
MKLNGFHLFIKSAYLLVKPPSAPTVAKNEQKQAAQEVIMATTEFLRIALVKSAHIKRKDKANDYMNYALNHQRKAMELYDMDAYEKAMEQSLKARKYAITIIDQSKNSMETADNEPVFASI